MPLNKPIYRSEVYRWQTDPNNPKRPIRGAALNSLKDFLTLKRQDPNALYGASDKPFKSTGTFTNSVSTLRHAHITHDLSIVYRLENGALYLYGFYSHDQLGTGTPANINKQKSMATRFSNEKFTENG
jgi:mRNA-degrading endonuclease YafQ of YafQ-DinJ toxin-antitoxin module